jgi:hypothetical protein
VHLVKQLLEKERANLKRKEKKSSVVEVMAWGIFCSPSGQSVNVE